MHLSDSIVIKELSTEILNKVKSKCNVNDEESLQNEIMKILSPYEIKDKRVMLDNNDLSTQIRNFLSAKDLEGCSKNTIKDYNTELNIFKNKIYKNVNDITTNDIRLFISQFPHLKTSSVVKKIFVLKSFFGWLFEEEIIEKNPTRKIKTPKTERRLPEALNIEELELLRENCKTRRERAVIEVSYSTGCRLSEIQNMNIKDIDWQNKSIKVFGKGNKERMVYLSFKAVYHLKRYLEERKDDCNALFITERRPYRRLSKRCIQKIYKKVSNRYSFNKNIHPHLMRATFGTNLLSNGANITDIQYLLGHNSLETSLEYLKISEDKVKEVHTKCLVQ